MEGGCGGKSEATLKRCRDWSVTINLLVAFRFCCSYTSNQSNDSSQNIRQGAVNITERESPNDSPALASLRLSCTTYRDLNSAAHAPSVHISRSIFARLQDTKFGLCDIETHPCGALIDYQAFESH